MGRVGGTFGCGGNRRAGKASALLLVSSAGVVVSDVRERVEGSTTVRIAGLDAKATSLAGIVFELEGIVSDGVSAATAAVAEWRGPHAETFVSEVNPFLVRLAGLVESVRSAKQTVAVWPEAPWFLDTITGQIEALGTMIEVPATLGESGADPAALDGLVMWCMWDVVERVPSLVGNVDLEGVTAEVTQEVPLDIFAPSPDPFGAGSILERPWGGAVRGAVRSAGAGDVDARDHHRRPGVVCRVAGPVR